MMKPIVKFFSIAVFLLILCTPAYTGELDKPYSPTRKEWLEIAIFKVIKDRTDVWKQRIGFIIWAKEEEKTVYITLSPASGQEPLSKEAEKQYVETVKRDVEELLKRYEWSKKLKVFVQFM
jgi:hypothetical protein